MLITHIYFHGQCKEAIAFYVKAFHATVKSIIQEPEPDGPVRHAEIFIHNQLLMFNDFGIGGPEDLFQSGGYQLCVTFDHEADLKAVYAVMEEGSSTISPMQATDYSPCVVQLIDKFDVRWALMVQV